MVIKEEKKKEVKVPIDNLVFKTFIEGYNNNYDGLLTEQKKLLQKYMITSPSSPPLGSASSSSRPTWKKSSV